MAQPGEHCQKQGNAPEFPRRLEVQTSGEPIPPSQATTNRTNKQAIRDCAVSYPEFSSGQSPRAYLKRLTGSGGGSRRQQPGH